MRAEMLRHPCVLGGPQGQAQGAKSEVAIRPLPSRGSPTLSAGSKIRNGCLTPEFLAAQKTAQMLRHPGTLGGPQRQARGEKSEVAISPLSPRGAKRGRKCFATHAFSEVPNAKSGEQIQNGCLNPALSGGQKRGRKCYVTPAFSGAPMPSAWNKIKHGCHSPPLSGGQKEGGNATTPVHSRRSPTPSAGSKIRHGCLSPALSGGQKDGGNATSPLHPRGSQRPSAGSKNRNGYLTPFFSGGKKRAEMLCHPYLLGCPQRQAQG